jgi:hypothetical protein
MRTWSDGFFGLFVLMTAALLVLGPARAAERWIVGPNGQPKSLADAVAAARDGDTIDILPGVYRGEHISIVNKRLTLRGVGKRPEFINDGEVSSFAAMWQLRGGEVTVENIAFRGARSRESDGAGIRQEGGRLTVRGCLFHDNEHGVLSLSSDTAELHIENSEFGMAPRVVGGLYHLLNVGRIAKLTVQGSRFQQGFEGHLIRSRARESRIAYNMVHDGPRGGVSYEIDLPQGGLVTLLGNVIGQGADSQNRVVVAYGAEGPGWPNSALYMAHNTFINHKLGPAWFLRVWHDRLPANTPVVALNNLLVGPGVFWLGAAGEFAGNYPAMRGMLRDADTYAFELPPTSWLRGRGLDLMRDKPGLGLVPQAEFEWPVGLRPLPAKAGPPTPGAYQR